MRDRAIPAGSSEGAWESFWLRTAGTAAFGPGGTLEQALGSFWGGFMADALARGEGGKVLDVACGNGAVAGLVAADGRAGLVVGADASLGALRALRRRNPAIQGAACDMRRLPFAAGAFDIIASQFGLEYAGDAAFSEAARALAPGGVMAAVVHFRDGSMYRENARNLEAMSAVADTGLLPALADAFGARRAVESGSGSRGALRESESRLIGAIGRVQEILDRHGAGVAGGAVARLHADARHLSGRAAAQRPDEVVGWAEAMASELEAFTGRMALMLEASLDADALARVEALLCGQGLGIVAREAASRGHDAPWAWILVARRD